MIGGLQGDFGDLDIKYLKKNISKCRSHISRSFRKTPQVESQLHSAGKLAFCCEVIRNPFCASAKSRRPRFHLRNGPQCFLTFAIDTLRYFSSDFCYLNPQTLLVSHQLQDSLAIKLGKRVNIHVIIIIIIFILNSTRELVLRDASFAQFWKEVKYRALALLFIYIFVFSFFFSFQPIKL